MDDKKLYIIAGCNGAGKTTASFTILPVILDCKEFVNADEIGVLLSIHDDENTSIDAYNAVIDKCLEFSLIELKQSGNRLISFEHLGIAYSVDPNRIFSRNGLINSIKKYNPRYPDQVIRGFSEFASKLLNDIIPKSKDIYIIALHNNGQNNLSINSYIDSKEAKETFVLFLSA